MLGLSATNAGTPSAQLRLYQSQLQQARREASQAADRVARPEQQSRVARQEAERGEADSVSPPPPSASRRMIRNASSDSPCGKASSTA